MDQKLLAWGLRGTSGALPRLWLFTDEQRLPDPRASVARLPRGRAGVVLRHDRHPARAIIGQDLARICRARRLVLVVAGDVRLAADLGAGVHLRGGHWPGSLRRRAGMLCRGSRSLCGGGMVTSSAHSIADLRHARAAGAVLVFLSPAFPTASHAGAPGLGSLRWSNMVRAAKVWRATPEHAGIYVAALGGVDGATLRRLPRPLLQAVGAIGALQSQ